MSYKKPVAYSLSLIAAMVSVLSSSPVMAEELAVQTVTTDVTVAGSGTGDLDATVPETLVPIAIQPAPTVSTVTVIDNPNEPVITYHRRGYHGRDVVDVDTAPVVHSETVSTTSTSYSRNGVVMTENADVTTGIDPVMDNSRIAGVMTLEEEANLAANSPADAE